MGEVLRFPKKVEQEADRRMAEVRLLELGFEMDGGKVTKVPELVYVVRAGVEEDIRDVKVDFEDDRFKYPVIRFKRGHRTREETLPVTSRWLSNPTKKE